MIYSTPVKIMEYVDALIWSLDHSKFIAKNLSLQLDSEKGTNPISDELKNVIENIGSLIGSCDSWRSGLENNSTKVYENQLNLESIT